MFRPHGERGQPGRRAARRHEAIRGACRGRPDRSRGPARRVPGAAGPVRLRQDDHAAHDRRLRRAERGRDRHRRPLRGRHPAQQAQRQHGLPGLRAVSAHDRARQRRVRAQAAQGRQGGALPPGRRGARAGPPHGPRAGEARRALGRHATAGRARARAGDEAEGAAARRAARRARPEAAQGDAGRAQADPARRRHHVHRGHARPGGGDGDGRPHRRHERGPHRPARRRPRTSTTVRRRRSWPTSSAR